MEPIDTPEHSASQPIQALLDVMARLRAPNGCPWDREQDHMTLRKYAIEEAYELLDAIEANDDPSIADELGDVLLQVVFHAQMASERGAFNFTDVCRGITEKMLRRHPHVFGTARADDANEVLTQWEQIKQAEKAARGTRPLTIGLEGIPRHLPALLQAEKWLKKHPLPTPTAADPEGVGIQLLRLVQAASAQGISAEEALRAELLRQAQTAKPNASDSQ